MQNVSDVESLVTAINSAIQGAGSSGTQAATAFKKAGIVASVNTDATGGKQLAFTSSTAAFQVQAGDKMANALMGNVQGVTSQGADIATTVAGGVTTAGAFTPTNVTVRITGGGLSKAVDLTFDSGSNTTALAITDLTSKVAGNASLQAAGITVSGSAGSALTFTSAQGEQLNVMVTGDLDNSLGFGSFVAGSGGAASYTAITGAAYDEAAANGTAHLEFSFNGAVSSANAVDIDLALGDATAAAATGNVTGTIADQVGKDLTFAVNGGAVRTVTFGATTTIAQAAAKINTDAVAGGWGVSASVDAGGFLVMTSATKGAGSSVNITGGTATAALGLTVADNTGTSRSAASLASALNDAFSTTAAFQSAGLKATVTGAGSDEITITSTNDSSFRVNAGASGPNANAGFGVKGATFNTLTVGASAASTVNSGGASNSTAISFTAIKYGNDDQTITVTANDAAGSMHSKTLLLRNDAEAQTGRSIDEAVHAINTALQQSNDTTLQKIVAVKENVGGVEKINFLSSLSSFKVTAGATSGAEGVAGGAGATQDSARLAGGATVDISTQANAQAAVTALAASVGTLGQAQAAVGKAQNQLGYAVNLAQSQISNFSAAESRIRDADIASEAANLDQGASVAAGFHGRYGAGQLRPAGGAGAVARLVHNRGLNTRMARGWALLPSPAFFASLHEQ